MGRGTAKRWRGTSPRTNTPLPAGEGLSLRERSERQGERVRGSRSPHRYQPPLIRPFGSPSPTGRRDRMSPRQSGRIAGPHQRPDGGGAAAIGGGGWGRRTREPARAAAPAGGLSPSPEPGREIGAETPGLARKRLRRLVLGVLRRARFWGRGWR